MYIAALESPHDHLSLHSVQCTAMSDIGLLALPAADLFGFSTTPLFSSPFFACGYGKLVISLLSLVVVEGGGCRWILMAVYGIGMDIDMDIVTGCHISSKTRLAY